MSIRRASDLKPVPLPTELRSKPAPTPHPYHYQPPFSNDGPGVLLQQGLIDAVTRHVLAHNVPRLAALPPPRALVVDGPAGEGKTSGVEHICSRAGVGVVHVSPAQLAGEREGAPFRAFETLKAQVADLGAENLNHPLCIVFDDLDLSILAPREAEPSIHCAMAQQIWQTLCDTGDIRSNGRTVPFVCTGNDFSGLRDSLFRPSRASFFHYVLTPSERTPKIASMFGLEPSEPLEQLSQTYDRPMAFWAALRTTIHADRLTGAYQKHGFNVEAIEAELAANDAATSLEDLERAAAAAATATNFLKYRR